MARQRHPLASGCSFWKQPPGTGLRLEAQRMTHPNKSVIKAKQKSPFAIKLKSFGSPRDNDCNENAGVSELMSCLAEWGIGVILSFRRFVGCSLK